MKGFIIYSDYTTIDNVNYIQLFGRLENQESFVTLSKFTPYFFIRESDLKQVERILKEQELKDKCKIEKTNFTDFQSNSVLKIISENQETQNKITKALHEEEMLTFEADIKPYTRFLIDNNLLGTIEISDKEDYETSERINRIYKNPEIKPGNFSAIGKIELKIASIDVESSKQDDKLFCIGIYAHNFKKNFMVTSNKLEHTISCKTEEECLEKFKQALIDLDPDVITGWNLIDFDFNYIKKLFDKYKIKFDLGRTNDNARIRIEENFFRNSSMDIPGRVVLDGLNFIKDPFIQEAPSIKNIKFENYTLEEVSQQIIKHSKLIKGKNRHEEIEKLYKTSKETQQKLVDYNLMDCQLVHEILEHTKMIELAIERSELTGNQIDKLTGSIANFDSLYIREAHKKNLVSPTTRFSDKQERIKGGFVMTPKPGLYNNVLVLDFKSLYPSIIKTFNIDPSSFVSKEQLKKHKLNEKDLIISPNNAHFKNQEGILPNIIEKLHQAREKAKREKRELSSYAIKIIMNSFFGVLASPNCRYFSLDIANAITNFGQEILKLTKEQIENLGYRVIYSDSVDGKSKIIIRENNVVLEKNIEDLFIKKDKESLGKEYNLKEKIEVLTLDEKGNSVFKPIKYVMRHKTNKKMYRVNFTNNWHIDVTEDHSLIGYQSLEFNNKKEYSLDFLKRLIKIKPEEIGKKARTIISLKKIPLENEETLNYPKKIYEFMGYFIGDGSFHRNKAHQRANKDYYLGLSLGSDEKEVLKKIIKPLKSMGYIKNYWLSKTRKGDMVLNGLKLINLLSKDFRDEKGKKCIPDWLFKEKEENIASFLRGLFSADGCVMIRAGSPIIKFTSIEDSYIKKVRKLLYRVGISHYVFTENSVNKYKTKEKIFCGNTYSKNIIIQNKEVFAKKIGFILDRKNKRASIKTNSSKKRNIKNFEFDIQAVKDLEEIPTPEYVYDIEVENNHKFFANYVLVHNTDSCFVHTKLEKEKAEKLGKEISEKIDKFYEDYVKKNYNRKSYLDLEFDKLFLALLMPSLRKSEDSEEQAKGAKKRYAGLVEEDNKEKLEITGLEAIRGDWTDAAQEFQKELLMKVFKNENPASFIKNFVKSLKSGELDKQLVYRKSIRKELKEYTKTTPPHVKAARKLEHLDSNIIEYYITLDGPEPIQKLKHKIDYEHYIDKQIKPIAKTILETIGIDFESLLEGTKQKTLF